MGGFDTGKSNRLFSKNLTENLSKNNMSQRDLARIAGLSEVSVSRYINGNRTPRGDILVRIARAVRTTPETLLGVEENEDSEMAYYKVFRTVINNADKWSAKQKAELVNTLFGV